VPFVIVAVLVVAALAVGVLFFVNRGGTASPRTSDPVAAVRGFLSALKDQNCAQARSYLTGNARVQAEGTCNTGQLDRFRFTDPVLIHRSSVQASVSVKASTGGQSVTLRLGLRKVQGKWLISDLNAD
jgi:limonene-1,2-epoxide hydrolase